MAIHISIDHFWTKDGQDYAFDQSRIQEAVAWTHEKYLAALEGISKDEKEAKRCAVFVMRGLPGSGKSFMVSLLERLLPDCYIFVDNTHTRRWEMQFYVQKAEEAKVPVIITHVECDLFTAFERGRHGVAWDKMVEMADRWEPVNGRSTDARLDRMESMMARIVKDSRRW